MKFKLLMLWRVSLAVWNDLMVTLAAALFAKAIRSFVIVPVQPGAPYMRIIVRVSPASLFVVGVKYTRRSGENFGASAVVHSTKHLLPSRPVAHQFSRSHGAILASILKPGDCADALGSVSSMSQPRSPTPLLLSARLSFQLSGVAAG